jgi:hypothetical protein
MQTARVESPKAVRRAFRGPSLIREINNFDHVKGGGRQH